MDQYSEIVKQELIKQELLEENEFKLEQDVLEDTPEYVDITLFSSEVPKKPEEQVLYECSSCPSKYNKFEYLTIHNTLHSETNVCVVCNKIIPCKRKFKHHLNLHIKENIQRDKKRNHVCDYCQKTFTTKKSIIIHTRVHTNERPYKCEICGEAFKQTGTLKVHYVTHTKERQFKCEICSGSYTTASSLKRHIRRIHDKGKVLQCKICEVTMYNMADFKSHKLNVHPGKGFKRKCQICLEVFYTRMTYRDHYRSQHKQFFLEEGKSIIRTYLCLLCGEKFLSSQSYSNHRRIHLGYTEEELKKAKERQLYKCKVCSKEVKSRDSLFKHMVLHLKKDFQCEICNKYYSYFRFRMHAREVHHTSQCRVCFKILANKRSLQSHYEVCHPLEWKKFHCILCGQQFNLKNKLNLHILLIHKQKMVKNYKCSHCGRRFLLANTLANHLSKFHKKQLKYKCQVCGITFNTRKENLSHKLAHKSANNSHKVNKRKQNKQKRLSRCRICLKIFKIQKNYNTHLKVNSCYKIINNVRKQQICHICCKYLSNRLTLKYHMKLHSDKDLTCRICGKLYRYIKAVRRHIKRAHPMEKVYWCECCKTGFDKFSDLHDHNVIHEGNEEPVDWKDNIHGNYSNIVKKENIDIKDEPFSY